MESQDPDLFYDLPISQLRNSITNFLINCLTESGGWRILAESFGIFDNVQIERFGRDPSPAYRLLNELGTHLCTVGILAERLRFCRLYMALSVICGHEPLVIVKQPWQIEPGVSNPEGDGRHIMFKPYGGALRLECEATGLPPPVYAWFRDNEELLNQTEEILLIEEFGPEHVGEYCCRISQRMPEGNSEELVSDSVEVELMPHIPEITLQPNSEVCPEGSDIKISFSLLESPSLGKVHFQWFKGNQSLPGCTCKDLEIKCASGSDEGIYRCFISNKAGELWTDEAKVTIYQAPEGRSLIAKEKFALLIGNDEYHSHTPLKTPSSDVDTLAKILKELQFKVVALKNLTLIEMRNALYCFCQMLPVGTYALFYFVGHGFEIQDKFMLPVDAPGSDSYLRTDSLCEAEVIKEVFETRPGLLVIILDMCLRVPDVKENPGIHSEVPPVFEFQPGERNLVKGYATTSNLGAYERVSEINGIYAKHLAKALSSHRDLPIVKVLEKVNEGVSNEAPDAAEKQMPFVSHNVVKNYCLSGEVEGDEEALLKYMELVQLPTVNGIPLELLFPKTNIRAKVYITPHRGSFLNSLDILIVGIEAWTVEFDMENQELRIEQQQTPTGKMATIHNLQRMKMALFLSVRLKDRDNHLVDHSMLDLQYPLASRWHLWHKRSKVTETLSTKSHK